MLFSSECRQVRNLLWDLASGTISGSERERAEAHVARCGTCRIELESYRKTISMMGEYKRDAVPASQLGWRDFQHRVASQGCDARGWTQRPLIQFAMGGGSLALATALVMFVMQANTNPPGAKTSPAIVKEVPADSVAAPGSGDFLAMVGVPSMTAMPSVPDVPEAPLRSAQPHVHRGPGRVFSNATNLTKAASAPQLTANDTIAVNVDGGGPVQPLRPEYVLASASSGNDEDQNRHYVIDVVSNTRTSGGSEVSEESHPW